MLRLNTRRGQGFTEYAFILGFIALFVVATSFGFQKFINPPSEKIALTLSNVAGVASGGDQNSPPPSGGGEQPGGQNPPPGDPSNGEPIYEDGSFIIYPEGVQTQ